MSTRDHERSARAATTDHPVRLAIVTVSDTRTLDDDHGGDLAKRLAEEGGLDVMVRRLVRDEADEIESTLVELAADPRVDAIVWLGGTGIGPRDVTVDVIRRHLEVELPGHGEQVRAIGIRDVGPAAILSRAIAGVSVSRDGHRVLVMTIPGSMRAVDAVMAEIVVPLLPHAIWEMRGRPATNAEPPSKQEVDVELRPGAEG